MDKQTEMKLIEKHDRLLKEILRKYGVPEDQLNICSMELLLVFGMIVLDLKGEYDAKK
jgi:hypothetical protein